MKQKTVTSANLDLGMEQNSFEKDGVITSTWLSIFKLELGSFQIIIYKDVIVIHAKAPVQS